MKSASFFLLFFLIFSAFAADDFSFEKKGRDVDNLVVRTRKAIFSAWSNTKKYYRLARSEAAQKAQQLRSEADKKIRDGVSAVRSGAETATRKTVSSVRDAGGAVKSSVRGKTRSAKGLVKDVIPDEDPF